MGAESGQRLAEVKQVIKELKEEEEQYESSSLECSNNG